MQLFYEPSIDTNTEDFMLNKENAQHCIKVLRKHVGDTITVVDGVGNFYDCELLSDNVKSCELKVLTTSSGIKLSKEIHIAIAPTKNIDRIEWFVEKAVEIGVSEITFLQTYHSERRHLKEERFEKKAISAMKQSGKAYLPKLNTLLPFSDFIKSQKNDGPVKFIAHVDDNVNHTLVDQAKNAQSVLILIGPEGDFSEQEIEEANTAGFQSVSLGSSRLRTETAGIVAITLLNNIDFAS